MHQIKSPHFVGLACWHGAQYVTLIGLFTPSSSGQGSVCVAPGREQCLSSGVAEALRRRGERRNGERGGGTERGKRGFLIYVAGLLLCSPAGRKEPGEPWHDWGGRGSLGTGKSLKSSNQRSALGRSVGFQWSSFRDGSLWLWDPPWCVTLCWRHRAEWKDRLH